jgi:hypothetical protein
LKAKAREKLNPSLGKIDIDYQVLHDAFFKWQTKPRFTSFGDVYYESKEYEVNCLCFFLFFFFFLLFTSFWCCLL